MAWRTNFIALTGSTAVGRAALRVSQTVSTCRRNFARSPSAEGARALGEAIGRGGANRARAAHDHVLDGPRRLPEVERRDHLELVRQEPLLDEQNGVAPGVKRHRPEVAGAAVDGDVQTTSTLIFRILVSMLR